jgi:curved DNA-binding protein CbpA
MFCVSQVEDGKASKQAHERFGKLRAAYEVLRDPARRAEYDKGALRSHTSQ